MSSPNPEHPLIGLVRQYKESNVPLHRWAAISLEEIYLQENSSSARVKGPHDPNLKYRPEVLRIVALHEGSFKGLGIVMSPTSREEISNLGRQLRAEVDALPPVGLVDRLTKTFVTEALEREGKQTVAALEVGKALDERTPVVQVLYPKLLRTLALDIIGAAGVPGSEIMGRELAGAMAMQFLRSMSFDGPEARLIIPEDHPLG